ncbi:MAG: hypothetical protein CFE46_01715 [Burkholderiales bacterium PBB6]|uniref:Uncharacterized protein n=1 Tax=Ideonella margarita TaxID=2984191 RepID=A0ABU9C4S0_9BURK|nr:MAG: hypothetical protein CFE46_01715 [Burkholderiales bacterium PBB6]
MNVTKAVFSAILALSAGVASAAPTVVTVDALANCLDLGTASAPALVKVYLPDGNYKASVVRSTNVPNPGYPDYINSNVGLFQAGNVLGGIAIGKSLKFKVAGGFDGDIHAFISDGICADNSGSTVIRFTPY